MAKVRGAMTEQAQAEQIANSVRRYRRAWRRYERNHPEIFNSIEQGRLHEELGFALGAVPADRDGLAPLRVLDLGCGSGNLSRHLLDHGATVVAADVSPEFLRQVEDRFGATGRLETVQINGQDLSALADDSVDAACAYSVLHHIPDYLAVIDEMCRVVRPGGVIFLDHEANDSFYDEDGCFRAMLREIEGHEAEPTPGWWDPEGKRWQRFLSPRRYVWKARLMLDPTYPWGVEGDIHIFPDDRIEWDQIEERLAAKGCEIVRRVDYLCYSSDYPIDVWRRFSETCTSTRLLIARRSP